MREWSGCLLRRDLHEQKRIKRIAARLEEVLGALKGTHMAKNDNHMKKCPFADKSILLVYLTFLS